MNIDIWKNHRRIFTLICVATFLSCASTQVYGQGSTTQQGLRFIHPSAPANSITLNPPSSITSYTLTLPTAAGTNGQVLQTDGSGNLSWTTPTSGTVTGSGTATQIAYWGGSSALTGSSTLYWDNTNTRIGIGTNSPQSEIHVNRGNALASYLQFTAGTTTGTTTSDGFEVGITSAGNAEIKQQENLPMLFYTNNTERMRILSGGSIGIGTSSPTTTLHVNGSERISGGSLTIDTSAASTAGTLVFYNPARTFSTTVKAGAQAANLTYTLPTAAPTAGQILSSDASGNLSWATATTGTVTGSGTATQVAYWSSSSALTSSSNLYWDNTNTRLGIGTASPSVALHVNGSGRISGGSLTIDTSAASTAGTLVFYNPARTFSTTVKAGAQAANLTYTLPTAAPTAGQILSSDASGNLSWATATTGTVTGSGTATQVAYWSSSSALTSSSNLYWDNTNTRLGIGTNSPSAASHNLTTDAATSTITVGEIIAHNSSGTPAAGFGAALKFTLKSSTTNDQDAAQINSLWTTATHASRASALTFSTLTGAGSLTERVRIDGSGNVGIGTTSPTTTLHVNGSGRISGGSLTIDTSAASTAGTLVFYNPARTFTTSFKAGANAANVAYTLPAADGSNGQVLQTNGSGTLSWATAATSSTAWMRAGNSSTVVGTDFLGTTDGNAFMIKTNGTERLRVANGTTITLGIQGTGATAPSSSFTFGSAGYTAASSSSNQAGSDLVIQSGPGTGTSTSAGDIIFQTPTAGATGTAVQSLTERMRIQNANTITLGVNGSGATAPPSSFTFGSAGYTAASSSTNQVGTDLIIQGGPGTGNTTSAGNIIFQTPTAGASGTTVQSQSEVMRITTTNRVGIGTNSPGQLLETMNGNTLLNNNNNTAAELRFAEPSSSGSNYTAFKAQAQGSNITYTLPSTDGSSGAFLTTNGAGSLSWVAMGTPYFAYKTADESVANSTTLQDEDDLQVSIAANEVWEVDYTLRVTGSSGDIKFAIVIPAGASMWLAAIGDAIGSNDDFVEVTSSGTGYVFDSANFAVSNSGTVIQIKGLVVNSSTAGAVKLQFCQRNSNASATSVKAMSYVRAARMQ